MTRWGPQGVPQGGYGGGENYDYQQQQQQTQYGDNESNYGAYNSSEGYGQPPLHYQRAGGDARGYAQPYSGSNEQPYQQYPPNEQYGAPGYGAQQYSAPQGPPPSHMQHQQQPYGYQPDQGYQPYGQQYPPPGGQVDAFRSHYEQPGGPIDPNQPYPPPGAEGDRGLMGALAGGAAGAYGGHKMGHGIIGGVGGAVAGSMLEDAVKKNRKEKKQRRGSNSSSSSDDSKHHHGAAGGVMAGNFHASSREVHLDGRSTLVAKCADPSGHHHWSSLDLNDCFTNANGRLEWVRGGNFAASARHIKLIDDGKGIEAELGDGRGGWVLNRIRLDERITNDNGRLEML